MADGLGRQRRFAKGETRPSRLVPPDVRPGFSDSFGVYNSRWQDYMTWNVQDWSSFSDRMRLGGFLPWGETPTHLQVFQGDTLIHDNPYSSDMQWEEVPAGNRPYRAVLDAARPADVFRLSTRTHTEWRFMSDTVDVGLLRAVLGDGARLPARDRPARRRPGRREAADLGAPVVLDLGTVPGKLTRVNLDVSYDGGARGTR